MDIRRGKNFSKEPPTLVVRDNGAWHQRVKLRALAVTKECGRALQRRSRSAPFDGPPSSILDRNGGVDEGEVAQALRHVSKMIAALRIEHLAENSDTRR